MHRLLSDKVHSMFSSAYSIQPTPPVESTAKSNLIPYEEGDLDKHGPYQWYDPASQPINPNPTASFKPNKKVNWSESTHPPAKQVAVT